MLTGVGRDSAAYREELFGPVAMVFKVSDEAEAVEVANDTPYGLGSYVYTNDPEQAARVADQLDAGMVFVNGVGAEGAELPFGGVKRSGFGRELGRYGIDEFVNKKLIRTVRPRDVTGGAALTVTVRAALSQALHPLVAPGRCDVLLHASDGEDGDSPQSAARGFDEGRPGVPAEWSDRPSARARQALLPRGSGPKPSDCWQDHDQAGRAEEDQRAPRAER